MFVAPSRSRVHVGLNGKYSTSPRTPGPGGLQPVDRVHGHEQQLPHAGGTLSNPFPSGFLAPVGLCAADC